MRRSYAPDGRCVSLLKVLLSAFCSNGCADCANRVSRSVRRALRHRRCRTADPGFARRHRPIARDVHALQRPAT